LAPTSPWTARSYPTSQTISHNLAERQLYRLGHSYPPKLLQFFANVEREWVNLGGFPHNGKMYGFYDPKDAAPGAYSKTGPFNPNFLAKLRARRGARLEAFNTYRESVDPSGLFYNEFLRNLLEG
jgi:hypothetical protein